MNNDLFEVLVKYIENQEDLFRLANNKKFRGYSISAIHTVAAIAAFEKANVTKISKELVMTKSAVSKILKKLSKEGIVQGYQIENNKKEIYYTLTNKGILLNEDHTKVHSFIKECNLRFFNKASAETLRTVYAFFNNYNIYLTSEISELERNNFKAKGVGNNEI